MTCGQVLHCYTKLLSLLLLPHLNQFATPHARTGRGVIPVVKYNQIYDDWEDAWMRTHAHKVCATNAAGLVEEAGNFEGKCRKL